MGATGQTGVTGGWPLLPRNAAVCSLTLGRCVIIKVMGTELSMRRRLQALAASRATRGPRVRGVSQVGGPSYHCMKLHLVSCLGSVLSPQLMGNSLSMRRRLQALAASRATRGPPVRRVSQVGGHFHHHMKLHLVSCLGSVLSPQLMGNPALNAPLLAGASGLTGDTGATGQTGVTGGWTLPPSHEVASRIMPWKCAITTTDG